MEKKYLYSMKLYITRYCPLNCKYCYVNNKDIKEYIMNFLVAKKSIDFFLKSEWKIKNIYLMWWEPLSEENLLVKILKYIINFNSKKNINIIIVTSGIYKISLKLEELINKYNNIKVSFSIDWLKQNHDKNRYLKNWKGTWEYVNNNIKFLNKNYNYCWTITVEEDEKIIWNLFKSFINMNKNLWFNYIHIWDVDWSKWNKYNIILYIKEIKKILDYIYKESLNNNFVYLAGFNRFLVKNNLYIKNKTKYFFCSNLKMFDIDYDGNVGSVFYSIKYNKNWYFNILDKYIDINKILDEKWSWMKILDKWNWIDLNLYLYKIYENNLNIFSKTYLSFMLEYNLYI